MIPDNCPACFDMPTQRMHMKELLASEEGQHKRLFSNLLNAMRPLMGEQNRDEGRRTNNDEDLGAPAAERASG